MGLLDSGAEEPRSKLFRHTISLIVLIVLLTAGIWYKFLRFHQEKKTVEQFLSTLIVGNTQEAYRLWHPQPSYSYSDFLQDWGPSGYYGPVKSYRIVTAEEPRRALGLSPSGVIVVVEVNPYQPFPSDNDVEKSRYTKEVRIWVEHSDQSLGYPP